MTGYNATILADSVSPNGVRLTTLEVTIPRPILPEFNTHREFSRNSASSRAIPVKKQVEKVLDNPFIPTKFGIDQRGMQSSKFLDGAKHDAAVKNVLIHRDRAVIGALEDMWGRAVVLSTFGEERLARIFLNGFTEEDKDAVRKVLDNYQSLSTQLRQDPEYNIDEVSPGFLGIHKQTLNRYLEPWMWQTIVVSATQWDNFFNLRIHPDAQAEIAIPARLMKEAMEASTPKKLGYGEWHLPLIQEDEWHLINESNLQDWKRVSAGRCARVSYLTHDGVRDIQKDIELCDSLEANWHMSPLEHVATPISEDYTGNTGNFTGWLQLRKENPQEAVFPG